MQMMIKGRQYNVALQQGRIIHSKIYILNYDLQRVAEIEGVVLDGGTFTIDATSDIRRTCSIQIAPTDSSFDLIAGDSVEASVKNANAKIWLDKYFQIFIGIEDEKNKRKPVYTNMGIYLIENPQQAYSADSNTLTISGVDMMAKLTGLRNGYLEGIEYQIKQGADIKESMIATLQEAKIPKYAISRPSDVAPLSDDGVTSTATDTIQADIAISVGDTAYSLLSALNNVNANFQIYFDVDGTFKYNMIPSGHNEPIMVNDELWHKVLISYDRSLDYDNVKNAIEVYGKTNDQGNTPTGYAWDNNPDSPFYVGYQCVDANGQPDYKYSYENYQKIMKNAPNLIRIVLTGGDYDNIQWVNGSSINLAQQRAEYELYLRDKLQDQITINCVPVYWLDVNWLIELTLPNKQGVEETNQYIIKTINTTLGTDGTQSITLMRYYPLYDF